MGRFIHFSAVISAERADLSSNENVNRTAHLAGLLMEHFGYADVVEGMFNGIVERSFIVNHLNTDKLSLLKNIAFEQFGQDAILVINTDRTGTYFWKDGSEVQLDGLFTRVEDAKGLVAYTKDLKSGDIYAFINAS